MICTIHTILINSLLDILDVAIAIHYTLQLDLIGKIKNTHKCRCQNVKPKKNIGVNLVLIINNNISYPNSNRKKNVNNTLFITHSLTFIFFIGWNSSESHHFMWDPFSKCDIHMIFIQRVNVKKSVYNTHWQIISHDTCSLITKIK